MISNRQLCFHSVRRVLKAEKNASALFLHRGFMATVFLLVTTLSCVCAAGEPSRLPGLIDEAYRNNQELLSMEANAEALLAEAPFAGSLPDPVVGVALLNVPVDTVDFDLEPMTQKQLFASQRFPWFGTLALRQQVSELKALEADFQVQVRRLEIARSLAGAWYDLGFIRKSLQTNESLKTLVTQVLRVAETRYATGRGLQQDILAGQVQHSELIDEGVTLASRERVVRGGIGLLLNRNDFFAEDGPMVLADLGEIPHRELLGRVALQLNPLLQARKTAIDRARVDVQLAEKGYLPDFDLRLGYGQRDDRPDFFSATVGITVPLWQSKRQDSQLAAAEKRLLAAQKSLLGFRQTLPHTIDQLLAEIDGARENHRLFRDALSLQAAHLADASLAAYSVGKIEFNTMLSARIRLLRIELKAESYRYQLYRKVAELEELIGTRLSSLEGVQ
jgi:outer membrane protein, heavy metal efflux system